MRALGFTSRQHRRRTALAALLVTAVVLGSCADDGRPTARSDVPDTSGSTESTGAAPAPGSAPSGFPGSWSPEPLEWDSCDAADDAECATLAVPLDWAAPDGPTVDLALARIPASGDRIGSLLTNPGGPGGSGIEFLGYHPFSSDLAERFDIVSWDPRGVGRSDGVDCTTEVAPFLALDPDPDDTAEQTSLDDGASAISADCQRRDGALLPHLGTPDVARDLEAIRRALGEESISFYGFSYGTSIGQQYAAYFPEQVRAMVLDGVVDPEDTFTEFLLGQSESFEANFAQQVEDCEAAGVGECGVTDLAAAYDEVRASVEADPLGSGDDVVGPAELAVAGIYSAYRSDGWAELGPALADAIDGSGAELLSLANSYYDLGGYSSYAAVVCVDTPAPDGAAAFRSFADEARRRSPRFGGSVANELLPCATWAARPTEGPESLGPLTAPGTPTILVIGNTGDPVTPIDDARAVAGRLGSAHLLTVDVDGHTAYGLDRCVDETADAYLIAPDRPIERTTCD